MLEKKAVLILNLWLFGLVIGQAQSLELLREVKIPTPASVSLDRYNRIFVGNEKGNVDQYDAEGKFLLTYSPPKQVRLSLLEAWNTTKIFAFSRDFQQYTLLDRFLAPIGQYSLDESGIGFARVASLAADDNLWLFDETDFSLKKLDLRNGSVSINAPMTQILDTRDYDLTFMREYQNMLLISDRNSGLLVFDNLGNYRKKLPFRGVSSFGMLNEEVYFLQGNQVRFFHLYTFGERSLELPEGIKTIQVLAFEDRLVLFSGNQMRIYRILKQ
jgi:hypothetical protein